MTTIQKRADELKPGDVVEVEGKGKCSVLFFERDFSSIDDVVTGTFGRHATGGVFTARLDGSESFAFDAPSLTAAQQHAEECFALLCHAYCGAVSTDTWRDEFLALRDKIDPPKPPEPPTLVEALEALRATLEYDARNVIGRINSGEPPHPRAIDLLDRARRAGLL